MVNTASDVGGSRHAAWVWLDDREPRDPEELVRFAANRAVREVFASVPWGGTDQRGRETVATMRRAGMRVRALGGSAEWAERPQLAQAWSVGAHVGELFACIHLDIEPWTLPTWPASALALLAGLADVVRLVGEETGRPVEVDLAPHVAATHPAGFLGIADAADAVTLMSYRDTTQALHRDGLPGGSCCVAVLRPGQAGQQRRWRAVSGGRGIELAWALASQVAASAQAAAVVCIGGALVNMALHVVQVTHRSTAPGVAAGLVAGDEEGAQGTGEESFAAVPFGEDTGDRVGAQPSHPDGRRARSVRGSDVPTLLAPCRRFSALTLGRAVPAFTVGLGLHLLALDLATWPACRVSLWLRGLVGTAVPWG